MLVKHGANVNQTSSWSFDTSPLILAFSMRHNRTTIVAYLIEHGADVNFVSKFNSTALDVFLSITKQLPAKEIQILFQLLIKAGVNLYGNNKTPEQRYIEAANDLLGYSLIKYSTALMRLSVIEGFLLKGFNRLNNTQKNIIQVYLSFAFEQANELRPSDAIKFLKALIQPNNFKTECRMEKLKNQGLWESVEQIHKILQHDCPQNRSESYPYVGQEKNYCMFRTEKYKLVTTTNKKTYKSAITYTDEQGNIVLENGRVILRENIISNRDESDFFIAKEKEGLLSLTGREDATSQPVSKEAVIIEIIQSVNAEIAKQIQLARTQEMAARIIQFWYKNTKAMQKKHEESKQKCNGFFQPLRSKLINPEHIKQDINAVVPQETHAELYELCNQNIMKHNCVDISDDEMEDKVEQLAQLIPNELLNIKSVAACLIINRNRSSVNTTQEYFYDNYYMAREILAGALILGVCQKNHNLKHLALDLISNMHLEDGIYGDLQYLLLDGPPSLSSVD